MKYKKECVEKLFSRIFSSLPTEEQIYNVNRFGLYGFEGDINEDK